MMKRIKYFLIYNVLSFFLINTFANADSHNISELLEIIQKDLKTLEKAVYTNSSSNDISLSSSSMSLAINELIKGHLSMYVSSISSKLPPNSINTFKQFLRL